MEGRAAARFLAAAGRERELEQLAAAHEQALASDRPAFACLHGPAGIGKSHLLRAFVRKLAGDGIPVVEARAEREGGVGLGLIRELAATLLALSSHRAAPAEIASLTSRLAPLLEGAGATSERPEERRLELADGLAELLRHCLPAGPVLVLEDLDAADPGSLELLRYLAALLLQPGCNQGCLVVLSWRDDKRPGSLPDWVERIPALHLPLEPLDVDGVRSFLARREVVERLFEATSGDPSRLEAVLSGAPADLGSWRLARLGSEARTLLLATAVLGPAATTQRLATACGRSDTQRILQRLAAEGFLRMRIEAAGAVWGFARDEDRQGILSLSTAEQVAATHLAAGKLLAAGGAAVEVVARHYLAGDPLGQGAIWAAQAAESLLARCDFDGAIEFFHAALGGGGAPRQLHLGLAAAYEALGDLLAALRHLGLSRRYADPAQRRAARSEAARLCIRIGKLAQAERLCRAVIGGGAGFDPADPVAARAWVDLAEIRFLRSDWEGAIAAAQEGIPGAAELPALRIGLRNTLGKALLARGRYDEAAEAFHLNIGEADRASLQREGMLSRINEGVAWHRKGDRERAIRLYRDGLAHGGDRSLVALALGNLAVLYHEVGDFTLALEHYGSALAAFTLLRRRDGIAHQGINRARLLLFLGDAEEAQRGVEHAQQEAERLGNPYLVAQAQLVSGEIRLLGGDPAGARPDLVAARDTLERVGNPRYLAETQLALVRVALQLGELQLARELLPLAQQRVEAVHGRDLRVELALLRAEHSLAAGEAEAALPPLEEAKVRLLATPSGVGGETDLEAPWRLYELLGRCHEVLGHPDAAAAHRVRARALLEELHSRVPAAMRAAFAAAPHRKGLLGWVDGEIGRERAGALRRLEAPPPPARKLLIGREKAFAQVLRRIEPLGRSLAPVVLRGESGTGKELVAAALHASSARAALPLCKVICDGVPEDRLLAELFGDEKQGRRGRFEESAGGTVFLDEIGALPQQAQVALLRLLDEKQIVRMGGEESVPVDVRLLCSTRRNLEGLVAAGHFREDLYYRLKGVILELPPLRERKADIAALAAHFLSLARAEQGGGPSRFSAEALSLLASWSWPGNVRELEHVVAAVALFAEGEVLCLQAFEQHGEFLQAVRRVEASGPEEAPVAGDGGPIDFYELARSRGIGVRELRHELEVQMIRRALQESKGNISEAARLLQMKRSRLSQIVNAEPELFAVARGAA